MKRKLVFSTLLIIATCLSACNLPASPTPTVIAPSPSETPAPSLTPVPSATVQGTITVTLPVFSPTPSDTPATSTGFTLEQLKNFTYTVESDTLQVTLVDGVYDGDMAHSRLVEPAAFGDLDGDGRADAVVVIATNTGGSGTFYDLVPLLDRGGAPQQVGFVPIGDRQVINDLRIQNGQVVLDFVTQKLSDPLCCPSEHRVRGYMLESGALKLASELLAGSETGTIEPLPNAIFIDQPAMYTTIANPQPVSGRINQVPASGTLDYYVTDMQATLLAQGSVPVEGAPGGPGTFAFEVALDAIPLGIIKIEVIDTAGGNLHGRAMVDLLAQ